MRPLIVKHAAKSVQQIAQQAAKQMGEEPFEIAKTAGQQVAGIESSSSSLPIQNKKQPIENSGMDIKALQEKDKVQSQAMYVNLQNEIKKISGNRAEEEKARMINETQQLPKESLIEPATKRSRNPLRGMAKKLADLGKKAEIRMPPSG